MSRHDLAPIPVAIKREFADEVSAPAALVDEGVVRHDAHAGLVRMRGNEQAHGGMRQSDDGGPATQWPPTTLSGFQGLPGRAVRVRQF